MAEKDNGSTCKYGLDMGRIWVRYGSDAADAWDKYRKTMSTGELLPVIGDRLIRMRPELVKTLYTFALVFAEK